MELPFTYDKPISGKKLIGRKNEIDTAIRSIMVDKKNLAIYGAPRSGKESFVRETLNILKSKKFNYILCEIDLFNIRSETEFIELFRRKIVEVFKDITRNSILPFEVNTERLPPKKILELPDIISQESGCHIIVYFKEFQNILTFESPSCGISVLDKLWSRHQYAIYIFTGSFTNMMKYIFLEKKYFYDRVTPIEMLPPQKNQVIDYITKSLLNQGRVIEQEQADDIYEITGGNLWYINQMCAILVSMPIGYPNQKIIDQVRKTLLSVNIPRYMQTMLDLTPNQINFLKAVLDKVQKFSSSKILEEYRLNSSANVFRLKDALKKKEVITFDNEDSARILDPLFEYWLKHYYFVSQQ